MNNIYLSIIKDINNESDKSKSAYSQYKRDYDLEEEKDDDNVFSYKHHHRNSSNSSIISNSNRINALKFAASTNECSLPSSPSYSSSSSSSSPNPFKSQTKLNKNHNNNLFSNEINNDDDLSQSPLRKIRSSLFENENPHFNNNNNQLFKAKSMISLPSTSIVNITSDFTLNNQSKTNRFQKKNLFNVDNEELIKRNINQNLSFNEYNSKELSNRQLVPPTPIIDADNPFIESSTKIKRKFEKNNLFNILSKKDSFLSQDTLLNFDESDDSDSSCPPSPLISNTPLKTTKSSKNLKNSDSTISLSNIDDDDAPYKHTRNYTKRMEQLSKSILQTKKNNNNKINFNNNNPTKTTTINLNESVDKSYTSNNTNTNTNTNTNQNFVYNTRSRSRQNLLLNFNDQNDKNNNKNYSKDGPIVDTTNKRSSKSKINSLGLKTRSVSSPIMKENNDMTENNNNIKYTQIKRTKSLSATNSSNTKVVTEKKIISLEDRSQNLFDKSYIIKNNLNLNNNINSNSNSKSKTNKSNSKSNNNSNNDIDTSTNTNINTTNNNNTNNNNNNNTNNNIKPNTNTNSNTNFDTNSIILSQYKSEKLNTSFSSSNLNNDPFHTTSLTYQNSLNLSSTPPLNSINNLNSQSPQMKTPTKSNSLLLSQDDTTKMDNPLISSTSNFVNMILLPKKTPQKTPSSKRRNSMCGDRFIPNYSSGDKETQYNLAGPLTPSKGKRRLPPGECDAVKEEQNKIYDSVVKLEILGQDLYDNPLEKITKQRTSVYSFKTPKKRTYQMMDSDSPSQHKYSLTPVSQASQNLLLTPRKATRHISKTPYKVLDAPELQDDFYLNLVDWSSTNQLSVGLGSCVYLWSACNSRVTRLCDLGPFDSVTSVNWMQKGTHLAVGTNRGLVQLWDIQRGRKIRQFSGHQARVGSLAWNGDILTSGSRDRQILNRDIRVSNDYIKKYLGHKQEVCGLKWNYEENQLASGGNDNKLIIWDKASTTPLYRLEDHVAAVKAVSWSPHQHGLLASGGGTADRKILFWNTLNGQCVQGIDTGSQVCNLSWSKTTNELVSTHGYSQNQIIIWKYPSMHQIATLIGHTYRVLYLAMSPDGQNIVTGAGDETLRFWNVFNKSKSKETQNGALSLFGHIR